jgi:hypothetical protein
MSEEAWKWLAHGNVARWSGRLYFVVEVNTVRETVQLVPLDAANVRVHVSSTWPHDLIRCDQCDEEANQLSEVPGSPCRSCAEGTMLLIAKGQRLETIERVANNVEELIMGRLRNLLLK